MRSATRVLAVALLAVAPLGCPEAEQPIIISDGGGGTAQQDVLTQVLETIADIAHASYSDSLASAQRLSDRIDALVADPTPETMRAARAAWLDAREPYGQTEIYRFQVGPIDALRDDGTIGVDGDGPEGRLNAWPLAEAIIDYVEPSFDDGEPETAIFPPAGVTTNIITDNIGDPSAITPALIESFNEVDGDESAVATGYHAIEFLLWGQDLNESPPFGPAAVVDRDDTWGQRSFEDYLPVGLGCLDGEGATNTCDARAAYLKAAMQILIADLARVVGAWAPDTPGNYRESFLAAGEASIATQMDAMGEFGEGELAGERMTTALLANSQEDEHSCFADNTHRDILLNALGIQNVYLGRYRGATPVSGKGIYDLLVDRGFTTEADALRDAIAESMEAVGAIDDEQRINGMTFDLLIQEGITQAEVSAAIGALEDQTVALEDAIDALAL